jgi:hypothetical protein
MPCASLAGLGPCWRLELLAARIAFCYGLGGSRGVRERSMMTSSIRAWRSGFSGGNVGVSVPAVGRSSWRGRPRQPKSLARWAACSVGLREYQARGPRRLQKETSSCERSFLMSSAADTLRGLEKEMSRLMSVIRQSSETLGTVDPQVVLLSTLNAGSF